MKKYNLFKVVGITFLVAVILTWLLPTANYSGSFYTSERAPLGLYDIIEYPFYTLGFFSNVVIFLLAVGGLYGVLETNEAYQKLLKLITKKMKGKEKYFLIGTILICAVISSIVGLNIGLFIVFPFLIAIILLLGYDKLTALAATFGATIIGMFGATFAGSMYTNINTTLSIEMTSEIITKLVLFVVGIVTLVFFTLKHGEKEKVKTSSEKEKDTKNKSIDGIKTWPLIVILSLLSVLLIMGTIDWTKAFNVKVFETMHTAIMNVAIKEWPVFNKIFGQIESFGNWSLNEYAFLIIMAIFVIALSYKVKFNDVIKDICDGAKKMLIPSAICIFAYSILVIAVYNPVFLNITNFLMNLTGKFNVAATVPAFAINSIFYVDISYYTQNVLPYIVGTFSDATLYPLIGVMFASIYGLMSLIMPTSILLIASLYFTETSYTKWMKYIWPVFLILLGTSTILFLIIYLI